MVFDSRAPQGHMVCVFLTQPITSLHACSKFSGVRDVSPSDAVVSSPIVGAGALTWPYCYMLFIEESMLAGIGLARVQYPFRQARLNPC